MSHISEEAGASTKSGVGSACHLVHNDSYYMQVSTAQERLNIAIEKSHPASTAEYIRLAAKVCLANGLDARGTRLQLYAVTQTEITAVGSGRRHSVQKLLQRVHKSKYFTKVTLKNQLELVLVDLRKLILASQQPAVSDLLARITLYNRPRPLLAPQTFRPQLMPLSSTSTAQHLTSHPVYASDTDDSLADRPSAARFQVMCVLSADPHLSLLSITQS